MLSRKLTIVGALMLLPMFIGQAVARPTIIDKRYWPNEVGPATQGQAYSANALFNEGEDNSPQPLARSKGTYTYQGGPKTGAWTYR
jgi:hypothetical protein